MNIYLDLVKTVLDKGIRRTNRTGVDTIMYFGYNYKVNLQKGFPLLTTKKMAWKTGKKKTLLNCRISNKSTPKTNRLQQS